jgi:hypothetical protein
MEPRNPVTLTAEQMAECKRKGQEIARNAARRQAARNTAETRSRVCTIGNKLAKDMGREAAFVKAWAMVKGGAMTLPVKGVTFGNRQEALRRLAAYQPAVIRAWFAPEPENKADPGAVAVMVMIQGGRGAYRLGYLPRQETAAVKALGARLPRLSLLPGDVYGARVTVRV